jgi:hypothetical protein
MKGRSLAAPLPTEVDALKDSGGQVIFPRWRAVAPSSQELGEESPDTRRQPTLRKQGRAERKFFATESVTENKPLYRAIPAATLGRPGSKGETAG